MAPHPISRAISSLGFGLGGAAMITYGKSAISFSGPVLLGIVFILAVTLIIIVYRLTSTVDVVAFAKAWRSEEKILPKQLEEGK